MTGATQSIRLFDLEEADRMLPLLRSIVKGMLDDHAERQALAERLEGARAHRGRALEPLEREIETLNEKILEAVVEIERLGAEFKGIELGLVDFPSMREGEIVYLCWQYGEDRIRWWHPVHAGYAGRRPIESD
ncbi:MAG: DUF2203 domain-containing protein [Gemmatimonadota bacterium]|jgi:hypothetical protein